MWLPSISPRVRQDAPDAPGARRFQGLVKGLILLALALAAVWLSAPGLLMVDSGPRTASAVVVLGGDLWTRPARAAEVWRESGARWLVVSGVGDARQTQSQLIKAGVPMDRILLEDDSTSTWENARFTIPLLRERGLNEVVVVTSWYHSRRALACFQAAGPDLTIFSRPVRHPTAARQWSSTRDLDRVAREFVKIGFYRVVHGVSP